MKAAISMIICLSFCFGLIECSCLSYGHSCWGAHGKRSSNSRIDNIPQERRWPMLQLNRNENDDDARYQPDESIDYIEKIPNILDLLRRANPPIIYVDADENGDVARDPNQHRTKTSVMARKRRSSQNRQPVAEHLAAMNEPSSETPAFQPLI